MGRDRAVRVALLVVVDLLGTAGALVLAALIRFGDGAGSWRLLAVDDPPLVFVGLLVTVPLVFGTLGLYRPSARWTQLGELRDVLRGVVVLGVTLLVLVVAFDLDTLSRVVLGLFVVLELLVVSLVRVVWHRLTRRLRRSRSDPQRLLIVGWSDAGADLTQAVAAEADLAIRVIGYLGDEDHVDLPRLGGVDDLAHVLATEVVDEVMLLGNAVGWNRVGSLAAVCAEQGKAVRIPLRDMGATLQHGEVEYIGGRPILSVSPAPERALELFVKRLLDVVGALSVGLVALVVLLVIVPIGLVGHGRPVLFSQERVGRNGRRFMLHKLRSMHPDADTEKAELLDQNEREGPAFKMEHDPRITPWGRFLRRTSLDELPQLWNVLRGDMSLVGPRPPLPDEVVAYDAWHRRRLAMKPGITGLWQVSARQDPSFDRWVEIDIDYIERWSLGLDLVILLRTIPAVLALGGR